MFLKKAVSIFFGFIFLNCLLFSSAAFSQGQKLNPLKLNPRQLYPFVFKQLGQIYTMCLHDSSCFLLPAETTLLKKLQDAHPTELKANALFFESGKVRPDLFTLDGNIRIAVTGSQIGSPIYINLDLAYPKDKNGQSYSLGLDRIVAILTHELGHHHEMQNHTQLDQLGLKVGKYFLAQLQFLSIAGNDNQDPQYRPYEIYLVSIQKPFVDVPSSIKPSASDTLLWIFDEFTATDITEQFAAQVRCPHHEGAELSTTLRFLNWETVTWRFGKQSEMHQCPGTTLNGGPLYRGVDFFTLSTDVIWNCPDLSATASLNIDFGFRKGCQTARIMIYDHLQNIRLNL